MALKIVAYTSDVTSDGQVVLTNSEEDSVISDNPQELLEFLGENFNEFDNGRSQRELKVVWDLDVFLAPLLRILGQKVCKELAGSGHASGNLFYIPSKVFAVTVGGRRNFFYHLAQYFEDEPDPHDPLEIHAKASILLDAFRSMELNPYKLTSPVAVYEAEVLNHLPEMPNVVEDLPESQIKGQDVDELVHWAEDCVGKLWIENFAVGKWQADEIWSYDIQAAFPSIAAQLYSIKHCKLAKSHFFAPDADWGFLKGKVTINPDILVSPIIYRGGNGNLLTPVGSTWEDIITLDQYNFIKKWGIGSFELDQGWFIKFTAPVCPMEQPLRRLFDMRYKGNNGLVNILAKRMAAGGCYGKMIEKHDDGTVGKFYNPLWAAMVSTRATLQVGEFIYQHKLQEHLVHVGVDGILSEKRAWGLNEERGMGKWKKNLSAPALVISPGRVYFGDKKPQGLTYDAIVKMIEEKPRESYYSAKLMRRQTLAEAVEAGDLRGLGEMKETHSSLDLNLLRTGQDRNFIWGYPRTGGELLTKKFYSKPVRL